MTIISRYLGITVSKTILLVLAVLLGLETLILFISQLGVLGNGDYGISQILSYVLLSLPAQLYKFFPMAGLIGIMLGLSQLASHGELIALRAAGLSFKQLSLILAKAILGIVFVVTLMGETIAPAGVHLAEKHRATALSAGQALATTQGMWIKDNRNFIYIQTILSPSLLQGVSRYEFNASLQLIGVTFAEQAVYQKPYWLFKNVAKSFISPEGVVAKQLLEEKVLLSLKPNFLKTVTIQPVDMSLVQLFVTMRYHKHSGSQAATFELTFWKRLWQPIASIVMMLLGIPFIFGPLRSATLGLRLLAGISIGFAFYILNEFFGPMSLVLQFPPLLAAALPSLVVVAVFIILWWRWLR